MCAVQRNGSRRAAPRNALVMPAVTEPSAGPRRVMIASHIATSAAAMNT